MRDPAIHDALLVGVGPAGAALGLVLARRGLRVTALERHADFSREFRGEGLQQSGYRVLQELLGADVERLPTRRFTEIQLAFGPRVVRGSVRGADLEHMRLVPQPPLLELLTERAARYPGYRLERGVVVRDLIVEDGRVVGVRATGPDGPRELRARLVIGVDGRSSIVRKRLAIELDLLAQRFDVLWARGDLGELMPADCAHAEVLREGGLVIAFHSPAGGQQIGVIIEKGGYRRLRDQGEAASLGWVRERCSPRTAAALAGDVGKPVLLDVICGRARRWSAPGALLLGDAAHPMSPVGAQGINMALRDVIVAANHLVPALTQGTDEALDGAVAAIERARLPEIIATQAAQTRAAWFFMRPGLTYMVGPWVARLRPLLRLLTGRRATHGRGRGELRLQV